MLGMIYLLGMAWKRRKGMKGMEDEMLFLLLILIILIAVAVILYLITSKIVKWDITPPSDGGEFGGGGAAGKY